MKLTTSQIAKEYALHTRTNIFLTGRAGTGKTTLLKEILAETKKRTVVVAPTGVAAINANGVTIHSMFQLPTTGFIPTNDNVNPGQFTNRRRLASTQKIRKERIQLLLELEMLVIDEISMVRADLLDAIDATLSRIRKNNEPFGGVQLIVIGDLYQLSPVVNHDTFRTLSNYYKSAYFFDSWVWNKAQTITIELTKVYRQDDQDFINILDNIRQGNKVSQDLEILNRRVQSIADQKNIITLSTHNAKTLAINNRQLEALDTEVFKLEAEVNGRFSPSAYPIDETITLKKGCQVMFIRNHPEGLYYNGKIGLITSMSDNELYVTCDNSPPIKVETVEWKNVQYTIDKKSKKVLKEDIGSFVQYPLKLAWAVTVHKSQGLTFDQVILDIADTFASGQLYVALSRCRSMEGLYLTSPVRQENIIIDQKIKSYYDEQSAVALSMDHLAQAKAEYEDILILEKWNFNKLLTYIEMWHEEIEDTHLPEEDKVYALVQDIDKAFKQLNTTSGKFQLQLKSLIATYKEDDQQLHVIIERAKKAIDYFTEQIHGQIIKPLENHYSQFKLKGKIRRYLNVVDSLVNDMWLKMNDFYLLEYRSIKIHPEPRVYKRIKLFDPDKKVSKRVKGETYSITLELLNEDKDISEIAKIRSLAVSTIESHMNRLLREDKISIDQIMSHERQKKILPYFEKLKEDETLGDLRPRIPFDVSFGELRWVQTLISKDEKSK